MKAALHIALTFFRFLPLQRALNVICAVLMALAVLTAALSHADLAMVPAYLGIATLALAPLMGGGLALRYYLALPTLALRPKGRGRVMLGATLAITLIAVLFTLPLLVARLLLPSVEQAHLFPANLFAMIWHGTALVWIFVFMVSNSRWGLLVMALLPFLIGKFAVKLVMLLFHAPWLLGAGLTVWLAFALWYLRPRLIRRVMWIGNAGTESARRSQAPVAESIEPCSRDTAVRQYLMGSPKLYGHALNGLIALASAALMMVLMHWATRGRQNTDAARWPVLFLTYFVVFGMVAGYTIARRARLLWLRAGLDRSELFLLAERTGLTASYVSAGTAAVGVALWLWARTPESGPGLLVALLALMLFAPCLFYLGMALTRGWNIADVLSGAGMFGLLVAHVLLLQPWAPTVGHGIPVLMGISLLLIPGLRFHARRRWKRLDWQVAGLPTLRKRIA